MEVENTLMVFGIPKIRHVSANQMFTTVGARNSNLEYRTPSQYRAFYSSFLEWFGFGMVGSTDVYIAMVPQRYYTVILYP